MRSALFLVALLACVRVASAKDWTSSQCQDLRDTKDNLAALYDNTLLSIGDVDATRDAITRSLDAWQERLDAVTNGSPEQFRAMGKWIIETTVHDMRSAIAWATKPVSATGIGDIGKLIASQLAKGKSPKDAVTDAITEWAHIQYANGSADLVKTFDAIVEKALGADKLAEHDAKRKELERIYKELIDKSRKNLELFVRKADELRQTEKQIAAYRDAVTKAISDGCAWEAATTDACGVAGTWNIQCTPADNACANKCTRHDWSYSLKIDGKMASGGTWDVDGRRATFDAGTCSLTLELLSGSSCGGLKMSLTFAGGEGRGTKEGACETTSRTSCKCTYTQTCTARR